MGMRRPKLWLFLLCGDIDITMTYAEDAAVTSHQDASAHVPAGESKCGDFVDGLSVIPTPGVLGKC